MATINHNWSQLPKEILESIAAKFDFVKDFMRFRAVCTSWRRVHLKPQFPWLMLKATEVSKHDAYGCFFSPSENKIRHLKLPEACGKHYWGSPYGWLVTVKDEQHLYLMNPITRVYFSFPPLSRSEVMGTYTHYQSIRAVLTVDVNNQNSNNRSGFVVFVLKGGSGRMQLGFARPGDISWTQIHGNINVPHDILYLNGKVFAVDREGFIMVCETIDCEYPIAKFFTHPPCNPTLNQMYYILEMRGEVHLAVRIIDEDSSDSWCNYKATTISIQVYKLDLYTGSWKRLETLEDYCIFIGHNTSFSLKASDYSSAKRGCVYFTDDDRMGSTRYFKVNRLDMGIFNLTSGSMEPFFQVEKILSFFSPAAWFTPMLSG